MGKTKTEKIVQALKARIASGALKEGDRVPSEASLAREFGVSRMTAREALRRLELEGFIRTEGTLGRFVTERAREALALFPPVSSDRVKEPLTLAASGTRKAPVQEPVTRTPFGSLEIDGKSYEILIDENDSLFIPIDASFERTEGLLLGDTVYRLHPVTEEEGRRKIYRILGLRPGKLNRLLKESRVLKAHFVRFAES